MQAVVLAGGKATRLRPLTNEQPKGLVKIAGKPLLSHLFDDLIPFVNELIVVVGYKGDMIINYYGDEYAETSITYVTQDQPLGTADAVRQAGPYIDGDFLVIMGDNVHESNLAEVFDLHIASEGDITFLTREYPINETPAAVCRFDDEGEIIGLVEKPDEPPSRITPTGFYILPEEAIHACHLVQPSHTDEYELTDAIDLLLRAGYSVTTAPFKGKRWNVNTIADITHIERCWRESFDLLDAP